MSPICIIKFHFPCGLPTMSKHIVGKKANKNLPLLPLIPIERGDKHINEREEFTQETQHTQQTATRTAQNQDKKNT